MREKQWRDIGAVPGRAGDALPAVLTESQSGFRVYRVAAQESEAALEALLPDPDQMVEKGIVYKPGSRGFSVRVELNGRVFFLKQYLCRSWHYRLRTMFGPSRAARTWRTSWSLLAGGISVPKPVLCLEERRFGLPGRAYFLCEFVTGARNLNEAWPQDPGAAGDLASRLGRMFGKMHRLGVVHGDLKWYNILLASGQGEERITLVDFDGSTVVRRLTYSRARKDLERFLTDLRQFDPAGRYRALVLESWKDRLGDPPVKRGRSD